MIECVTIVFEVTIGSCSSLHDDALWALRCCNAKSILHADQLLLQGDKVCTLTRMKFSS